MFLTGNPLADFLLKDAEDQRFLNKLPKCDECGEPIQDDECYEINDEYICPECLKNNHRRWVETLMEDYK